MNVLVIGSGGREHALAWRLAQSPSVTRVFASPGNPGIAQSATCLSGTNYLELAAEHGIDLTVVGPEAPLIDGVVDQFRQAGRPIFGPVQAAAQLEGSKIFSKNFFARHHIPTARFHTATNEADALRALEDFTAPVVLKADGLAAGKGVVIAQTMDEARTTVRQFMAGELVGAAGQRLVIEEFLTGEEVSFIALSDGETILPLLPSQDHKNIFDNDQGPNTGGMGAYVDERILKPEQTQTVLDTVMRPAIEGMKKEGSPFTGFLYAGLMMTANGPKTLEFNVRMGDPETQPIMYRLQSDLGEVLFAGATGKLHQTALQWSPEPSVAIVLAAAGYPGKPATGDVITGIAEAEALGAKVFHAGTKLDSSGQLVTAGGRVLAVTASAPSLPQAIENAYKAAAPVRFAGMQFRKDIGNKGLKRW
ncbi:MAG TPA: phosphoribosylamine--glycine ligase [Bryobacteraceae bacterium]|nr:phosphoribosylamine--glycine ligase [Bryobacteraceae bacterium]